MIGCEGDPCPIDKTSRGRWSWAKELSVGKECFRDWAKARVLLPNPEWLISSSNKVLPKARQVPVDARIFRIEPIRLLVAPSGHVRRPSEPSGQTSESPQMQLNVSLQAKSTI